MKNAATLSPRVPAQVVIERLCDGWSLDRDEAETLFDAIVEGRLGEDEIAAALTALRHKGETADELIGAAFALRRSALPFDRPDYLFADSCGTGGDGAGTINVSTAVAFVAAAVGLPVAKHGNRSVTSKCGSADVLEQLGARLDCPPPVSRRALDQTGVCFLLAPQYHPGMRHAAAARRRLKFRTIMNALGPCLNPARPPVQLLGVSDRRLLEPVAATLAALETRSALIVHGAGLDEMALHGPTEAIRLVDGAIERCTFRPEDAGFESMALDDVKGGSPDQNAARLEALLAGRGSEAERRLVSINCGALLMAAGMAADLREGAAIALDVLSSGAPFRTLQAFVVATHA